MQLNHNQLIKRMYKSGNADMIPDHAHLLGIAHFREDADRCWGGINDKRLYTMVRISDSLINSRFVTVIYFIPLLSQLLIIDNINFSWTSSVQASTRSGSAHICIVCI